MADNDQDNDEYKFDETDSMGEESMEEQSKSSSGSSSGIGSYLSEKKDIRRNALIVVVIVVALYILYQLAGVLFFRKTAVKPPIPVAQIAAQPIVVQPAVIQAPEPQVQPVARESDPELKQKVSEIEASEQSIKTEVNSVSDKVSNVTTTVNSLNDQIVKLSQVITELSNQVAKQADELAALRTRSRPNRARRLVSYPIPRSIHYNIQAVIPGRAWLIASNGSTLTVREGTTVKGYGVVKLIDSIQGRVITSSGRVIRFSQDDS